jgi:hypothetical protein
MNREPNAAERAVRGASGAGSDMSWEADAQTPR